jgi:DNA-directed RNA polymerase subunit RPC12/RpoP
MVDGGFYCADCGKQFKEKDIMNAKIIVQGGINI